MVLPTDCSEEGFATTLTLYGDTTLPKLTWSNSIGVKSLLYKPIQSPVLFKPAPAAIIKPLGGISPERVRNSDSVGLPSGSVNSLNCHPERSIVSDVGL